MRAAILGPARNYKHIPLLRDMAWLGRLRSPLSVSTRSHGKFESNGHSESGQGSTVGMRIAVSLT